MGKPTAKSLHEMGARIAEAAKIDMSVRRCVFGHGYPNCGCTWRLVAVSETGGYTTAMVLGDTIPKALASLRGVLFGMNYANAKKGE